MNCTLTVAQLNLVVQGQKDSTIVKESKSNYLSKMKVMTSLLNSIPGLRSDAIELTEGGLPVYHTGLAKHVIKLRLPMTENTARLLFAAISIDTELPRSRKRRISTTEDIPDIDPTNPARNSQTVDKQTYQNYKSALK